MRIRDSILILKNGTTKRELKTVLFFSSLVWLAYRFIHRSSVRSKIFIIFLNDLRMKLHLFFVFK